MGHWDGNVSEEVPGQGRLQDGPVGDGGDGVAVVDVGSDAKSTLFMMKMDSSI